MLPKFVSINLNHGYSRTEGVGKGYRPLWWLFCHGHFEMAHSKQQKPTFSTSTGKRSISDSLFKRQNNFISKDKILDKMLLISMALNKI